MAARDRGTPSRLLKILGDKILGVVVKALKNARDFLQVLGTEEQLLQISDEVGLEPDLPTRATLSQAAYCGSS